MKSLFYPCGAVERTDHFLFECQRYTNLIHINQYYGNRRITAVSTGRTPILSLLLSDDDRLGKNVNELIFQKTETY